MCVCIHVLCFWASRDWNTRTLKSVIECLYEYDVACENVSRVAVCVAVCVAVRVAKFDVEYENVSPVAVCVAVCVRVCVTVCVTVL